MAQYNSGRKKKFNQTDITSDRYEYLGLEQAEPDLGDPIVGVGSTGNNPKPAGQTYVLAAVDGYVGKRYWAPITTDSNNEIDVEGLQGAQGAQGLQGAQGVQNSQGAQGIQGAQGVQGSGDQGAQGTQGLQGGGSQGAQGAQGTQGLQGGGSQGAQGSQGSQGLQGLQGGGSQGSQGTQGAQGAQGTQGLLGKAANWIRKTSNYTTVDGEQIIADTSDGQFTITLPSSPSGGEIVRIADGGDWTQTSLIIARNGSKIEGYEENLEVDIGNTILDIIYESDGTSSTWQVYSSLGAQGPQGLQGLQGLQGAQGVQNSQGTQGLQGPQGVQGLQGPQGLQGTQGSGSQGAQGVQGSGDQGAQGLQGLQGVDGDFTSITYAIMDPRDDSLEKDGVSIKTASSITNLPNDYTLLATQNTKLFLFDQDSSARVVSTGDRRVYLRYLHKMHFAVSKSSNSGWGDPPESGEDLHLQWYGFQGNTVGWHDIIKIEHDSSDFRTANNQEINHWVNYTVNVPANAKTYEGVKLRFYQPTSDSTNDNWAVTALLAQIGGDQGTQGTQGAQGTQGTQGLQGTLSNHQGTQGNQSGQGVQGKSNQGAQGSQGVQNAQGTQGRQGRQGTQGLQGTLSNFQGTQGTQGVQALQGTSGTDNVSVIFLSMIF